MRMRSVKLYMAAFLVLLSFAVPGFSLRAAADGEKDGPQLYARSAVLMDADSGRVLFGKEEGVARPMASTTKIMTCILALEEGEMEQACTVSAGAAASPRSASASGRGRGTGLRISSTPSCWNPTTTAQS